MYDIRTINEKNNALIIYINLSIFKKIYFIYALN